MWAIPREPLKQPGKILHFCNLTEMKGSSHSHTYKVKCASKFTLKIELSDNGKPGENRGRKAMGLTSLL